jgi:hypothetical protein
MASESKLDTERGLSRKLAHSIPGVGALSGLGRSKIFAEIKEGRLIAHKCGRRTLILDDNLLRWLRNLPAVKTRAMFSSTSKGPEQ